MFFLWFKGTKHFLFCCWEVFPSCASICKPAPLFLGSSVCRSDSPTVSVYSLTFFFSLLVSPVSQAVHIHSLFIRLIASSNLWGGDKMGRKKRACISRTGDDKNRGNDIQSEFLFSSSTSSSFSWLLSLHLAQQSMYIRQKRNNQPEAEDAISNWILKKNKEFIVQVVRRSSSPFSLLDFAFSFSYLL